jgi:peptide deformylase
LGWGEKLKQESPFLKFTLLVIENKILIMEIKMALEIITYGNSLLRQHAKEIKSFDQDLIDLADEMYSLMKKTDGIGLAATQVGKLIRMVIVETSDKNSLGRLNLVNPVILTASENLVPYEEGCLSVPGIYGYVKRPDSIRVEARTLTGEKITFNANGMLARVIQHEVDHLNGILFVDHLSKSHLKKVKKDLDKLEKANLVS